MPLELVRTAGTRALVLAGITTMAVQACGPEALSEEGAVCRSVCKQTLCPGDIDPLPTYIDDCTEICLDHGERASEASAACGEAYEEAVSCVSELECVEFIGWMERPNVSEYPCREAEARFAEACPGLVFAPTMAPIEP